MRVEVNGGVQRRGGGSCVLCNDLYISEKIPYTRLRQVHEVPVFRLARQGVGDAVLGSEGVR